MINFHELQNILGDIYVKQLRSVFHKTCPNYINKVASYLGCVSFKTRLSFYSIHGRNVSFKIVLFLVFQQFLSVYHFNEILLATFFPINKMSSVYFAGLEVLVACACS